MPQGQLKMESAASVRPPGLHEGSNWHIVHPVNGRTSVPATLMKSSSCGGGPTPAYLRDTQPKVSIMNHSSLVPSDAVVVETSVNV